MESSNENTQECSIKIDTIWSEADENLLIKEEIVSDLEPDSVTSQNNGNSFEHQIDALVEDESNCNGYFDASLLSNWQPLKKKVKSRTQRSEESEMIFKHKLSCLHDPKNFKIVKRRLRCGDCRSLVCPECCKIMIPNLQSHFLGSGVCNSGTYLCKLCSIIFHSLCALQAHIRIHTMDTPYVCPDCGLIYNNISFLILHLLNKCYHVYKIVRYKCKHCPGAYFTPETFVQHIQERHIHCVFRCLYCSSLFNNYDEFNYHMENLHQKQKVQYLNYFRCSLCSNMVIPRFMYQRHIAQHRENSEFYEVDYQCLCGETYNLMGAFRSHFSYCNKKGILPPKWSFLQRKLRTHDVVHPENFQNKDVMIQPLPVYSNNDTDFKKLSSDITDEKNVVSEKREIENGKLSMKNNCTTSEEENVKKCSRDVNGQSSCKKGNKKLNEESDSYNNNSSSCKPVVDLNSLIQKKTSDMSRGTKTTSENLEKPEKKINTVNEAPNPELEQNCSKDAACESTTADSTKPTEENNDTKSNKESEQCDGDLAKIYDHIPCDHLGYVIKSQCIEPSKKPCQEDDIILEKCFSPKSYKIVTELDEKTGVITTKTVPLDELDFDEEEEEENINYDDCDMEGVNFSATAKQYSNDKNKFRVGNSLNCPFCIVLFPKHNLTFQQFRLHLESYHPDAALNITVNKDADIRPDKIFAKKLDVIEKENIDFKEFKYNYEEGSKSEFPDTFTSSVDIVENQNEVSQILVSENSDINSDKNNPTDPELVNNKALHYENEKQNIGNELNVHKSVNENACQSDRPLTDNNNDKGNQFLDSKDFRAETLSTQVDIMSTQVDITYDDKELDQEKKEKVKVTKSKNDEEKSNTNEEKVGKNFDECLKNNTEKNEKIRQIEEITESRNKTSPKTLSDLEYEGETSKDSNWSGISNKDVKIISTLEFKTEEKERCRRESEVWSEFYESLMLAEKLKKKKNPSPESDAKKKSVVSDYSAKRVVKKPKRYRESSESGDSNEFSESDEEFLLENDLMNKIYPEEKSEADIQVNKKQILMNKLENVDSRFVDYLLDLVTKKEKLFELYKKHSALRASRYSHDLRSYRKKVLNGIKQRGRPLKIFRYRELLRRKELAGDKNNKESFQPQKNSEFFPENKTNERKRGRPRKYHDAAKLKERRKSDKEVDFIEKNFEREESDLSPSKRKRKLSSKLQYYRKMGDEKDDFSSGQVITNKPADSSKKFTCAVCKEVFLELTEFREHIVVHRMEENSYQCMECGECFVVRPSLEKHLHAFHKIKNTDKYITDNHCCNIKKEIVDVDNEPLKENQCKVCKDQFDRPIDLTKHFRIHGMAFLKEFKKEGKSNEKRSVQ